MTVLVLGCNGQLGTALQDTAPTAIEVLGRDLPEVDITSYDSVRDIAASCDPTVIINAAAFTAVDDAESVPSIAASINTDGPRIVAEIAREFGARLVHISTDFVFAGDSREPYAPEDATAPLSVYGRTKREGEIAVLDTVPDSSIILRTAWLYGKTGGNFVKTMLRLMRERDEIAVVMDQVGTPTWANSLALTTWSFVARPDVNGVYHWTDGGRASWFDFAVAIQEEALSLGLLTRKVPVKPITTEDFPTAARRPQFSVLDCSRTSAVLGVPQTDWRQNLRAALRELENKDA